MTMRAKIAADGNAAILGNNEPPVNIDHWR